MLRIQLNQAITLTSADDARTDLKMAVMQRDDTIFFTPQIGQFFTYGKDADTVTCHVHEIMFFATLDIISLICCQDFTTDPEKFERLVERDQRHGFKQVDPNRIAGVRGCERDCGFEDAGE